MPNRFEKPSSADADKERLEKSSSSESVEEKEKGVGKNQKKYRDHEGTSHNVGNLKEQLSPEARKKLEKKRQNKARNQESDEDRSAA